ncbi:MAG: LLM class flavin-dependent oxidoreductase [Rhodovarius sp.]|nr:LLM class flavin-dependent oxidoreductase [Rhodovarius sp.]MCX7931272.1 LLM class flavin-dependent oxidoreductase [Rhodovarius sp.]MDW8315170.1 LLM class flavin-dependent oxidoreductase [Rhodovarius sp.]
MAHAGLKFGIFLAPFHRLGDNPTLAIHRDLELIAWLDHLGYDEAWIGEHHSGGWEIIASPEVFIAAAIERTRHIRLGSGVTSLPYHHPLLVAQRFVQLDHMSRGRIMLGCGPGALASDAYMMGIPAESQRRRMEEALAAILALLACEEPVSMQTDWFTLREARLHLAPYTHPRFPIAVAASTTPAGVLAAARHGLGLLSLGAGLPGGPQKLAEQWRLAEAEAAKHGQRMDRAEWRLVVTMHCAEDDERAMRDVAAGERLETEGYFGEVLARPPTRSEDPLGEGLRAGTTLVGSPETVARGIERLLSFTEGGAGGVLFRAHEWADREATWRSFELFARWVMPRFQGSLRMPTASRDWCVANRGGIFAPNIAALRKAFTDAGMEVPESQRLMLREG